MIGRWRYVAAVLLASWQSGAKAAGETSDLAGTVTVGALSRPAGIRLACDASVAKGSVGRLALTLVVGDFETLEKTFDFGAFEGPDAVRAPPSDLRLQPPGGSVPVRLPVSGSVAADPATTFLLSAEATMRGDAAGLARLRATVAAMSAGPSELVWTLSSPRKGDAALVATATIQAADAARFRAAAAPCLANP